MVDEYLLILDANTPSEIPDLERRGAAFTVRKGKDSPKISETKYLLELNEQWAVAIEEYVDVFFRIKRFYCYDVASYLSAMAAFCGCESIVIPAADLSKEEWLSTRSEGYFKGVSYGLNYTEEDRKQVPELRATLGKYIEENQKSVKGLIKVIEREWGVGVLPLKQVKREWVKKSNIPFTVYPYKLPDTITRVEKVYKKIVRQYNERNAKLPQIIVFSGIDHQSLPFVTFVKGFLTSGTVTTEAKYVIIYRGTKTLDLSVLCFYISWVKACPYLGGVFLDINGEILPYNEETVNQYFAFILPKKLLEFMDFSQEDVFGRFFEKLPEFGYAP